MDKNAATKKVLGALLAAKVAAPSARTLKQRAGEVLGEVGGRSGEMIEVGKDNWQATAASVSAIPGVVREQVAAGTKSVGRRARAVPDELGRLSRKSLARVTDLAPTPTSLSHLLPLSTAGAAGGWRPSRRRLIVIAGSALFAALIAGVGFRWLRKKKTREQMAAVDELAEKAIADESAAESAPAEQTSVIIRNGTDPSHAVSSHPDKPMGN
jgi:hypothetical protein